MVSKDMRGTLPAGDAGGERNGEASFRRPEISPWVPMSRPIDLKHLGKLAEELNECGAAVARCLIQGIAEQEPDTGKVNRDWLQEEMADVLANIELVIGHFNLDLEAIEKRVTRKAAGLRQWHRMLP